MRSKTGNRGISGWRGGVFLAAIASVCLQSPLACHGAEEPGSAVFNYPSLKDDVASTQTSLKVNGTVVPCINYQKGGTCLFAVARFASGDATPRYVVTGTEDVASYRIHPERHYPPDAVKVEGKSISFKGNAALRYVLVELNGRKPFLAIVNDPPEDPDESPVPSAGNVLDVTRFVKDTSGATDVSADIKAAVDELYRNERYDTLYFPDGTYLYGGLELRGRQGKPVTIYVSPGALLKNRIQPSVDSMEPAIGIWDSSEITIAGRGMFDGNGYANYDTSRGGWPHHANVSHHQGGVMVVRSSNITFRDTYVRDSKQWNYETHTAKHVNFRNIKAFTPYPQPWVDGIDLASGQDITIDGALTLGNDDCFASGHYNPDNLFVEAEDRLTWDTEDTNRVVVKNTLHWSCEAGNGIRLGHDVMGHKLLDYTFDNFNAVNFKGGGRGITVQNGRNNGRDYPHYESLTFRNCSFDTTRVDRNVQILGLDGDTTIGSVLLSDCWFSNPAASFEFSNIDRLTIQRLFLGGMPVAEKPDTAFSLSNVQRPTLDFRPTSH